tara:strand:- start:260 stop:619 length:360 start_codon:yes stop_codon:yes gene_type:complete
MRDLTQQTDTTQGGLMGTEDKIYLESKDIFSIANDKAFAREDLIFNTTEDLLIVLEDLSLSKAELAKRLGKSEAYTIQVLSGTKEMTLGVLSDICFALGLKPEIRISAQPTNFTGEYLR